MKALSVDRIADEALALLSEKGLDGFSLRALAGRLSVTPMALYHHVPDKAALAALACDRAMAGRPMPEMTGAWDEDLLLMARGMRRTALDYPFLPELRRAFQVYTPAMLAQTEEWLNLWRKSGLEPRLAFMASSSSGLAIAGLISEEAHHRSVRASGGDAREGSPDLSAFDTSDSAMADMFDLSARSIIQGAYARLSAQA